jgi:hypothetical protein
MLDGQIKDTQLENGIAIIFAARLALSFLKKHSYWQICNGKKRRRYSFGGGKTERPMEW